MFISRLRAIRLLFSSFRNFHFAEKTDRFGAVHIDLTGDQQVEVPAKEFDNLLRGRLESLLASAAAPALWLHVPLRLGYLLPLAAQHGLQFHHAEYETAALCRWLQPEPNRIPRFATHQVGIAGIVLNDDQELLMVKEKTKRYTGWKFPTGLVNLGETFGEAAEREVFEETGVKSQFQSVFGFRHSQHHPGAFGRSDIMVACRLRPLSSDIVMCNFEITACQWLPLADIDDSEFPHLPRKMLSLVRLGLRHGWDRFELPEKQYPAVYSGKVFDLYYKPCGEEE